MANVREYLSDDRKLNWCDIFAIVAILAAIIGSIVVLAHTLFPQSILTSSPDSPDTPISLQQVSILFRHGDRNPLSSYPNNPHRDYVWPNGLGALTKKGMRQLYKLGKRLRGMYGPFIGDEYRSEDIIVRSSFEDRCIMSAQALLASFYQPSFEDEFEPGLAWQPVPVYQIPKKMDKWIAAKAPCPRLERDKEQVFSNFTEKSSMSIPSYYKELSAITGKEISTLLEAATVFDTLLIEMLHGLRLPKWVNDYHYHLLHHLMNSYLVLLAGNLLQKRLEAGPLLKEISENMVNRRNGTDQHKLYLYSGHDLTLVSLMRTMGIAGEIPRPEYGASLIFELHTADDGRHNEVKILYLNNTETTEKHVIKIPGCGDPCLLDNLVKIWEPVLPENWEHECLT